MQQGERGGLCVAGELGGRDPAEDRIGDHEGAGQADGVGEGNADPAGPDRQPGRRDAAHRPADQYQAVGVVDPLTGEMHRLEQIGAPAVVGV